MKTSFIELINNILTLDLKDISFYGVEHLNTIEEYEFDIMILNGIIKNNLKKKIFIKMIKRGKIKETVFCICYMAHEKYFNKSNSKDELKKLKKITILQEKGNKEHINKISVNLFEDDFYQKKVNIEINFIDIFKIIEQNKKYKKKGWENIEINQNNILIVGIKN